VKLVQSLWYTLYQIMSTCWKAHTFGWSYVTVMMIMSHMNSDRESRSPCFLSTDWLSHIDQWTTPWLDSRDKISDLDSRNKNRLLLQLFHGFRFILRNVVQPCCHSPHVATGHLSVATWSLSKSCIEIEGSNKL
jgi:hypothetical protein